MRIQEPGQSRFPGVAIKRVVCMRQHSPVEKRLKVVRHSVGCHDKRRI